MKWPALSKREAERLAVLRVVLMAAGPEAVKVEVWRADALDLLSVGDRLTNRRSPAVQSHETLTGPLAGSYITGPIYITAAGAVSADEVSRND
jgi:hypothetical protein